MTPDERTLLEGIRSAVREYDVTDPQWEAIKADVARYGPGADSVTLEVRPAYRDESAGGPPGWEYAAGLYSPQSRMYLHRDGAWETWPE